MPILAIQSDDDDDDDGNAECYDDDDDDDDDDLGDAGSPVALRMQPL